MKWTLRQNSAKGKETRCKLVLPPLGLAESCNSFDQEISTACTKESGGILTDTAISGKEQKQVAKEGLDFAKGLAKFGKFADTFTHDNKNATEFVDSVYADLETWYNTGTGEEAVRANARIFIEAVEDDPSLKSRDDIRKASKAMISMLERDNHAQK